MKQTLSIGSFLLLSTFFLFFIKQNANAQQFYRIGAEYSIKYKGADGRQMLQLGKVCYDINNKTIVVKTTFPSEEMMVQKGGETRKIVNSQVVQTYKSVVPVELSIFHLALSNQLENFGLNNLGYQMVSIKKEKGLVMTAWKPAKKYQKQLSEILISTKNKQLFAIVFFGKNDKIVAKHFYRNYTNTNGFLFPTEIVRISYTNKKKGYQLTNYKNIILNNFDNDECGAKW